MHALLCGYHKQPSSTGDLARRIIYQPKETTAELRNTEAELGQEAVTRYVSYFDDLKRIYKVIKTTRIRPPRSPPPEGRNDTMKKDDM
jgi:hypothetical protein